jgi:FixJ family two-component response regulator
MSYSEQARALVASEDRAGHSRLHEVFVVSGDEYVRHCVGRALWAQGVSPVVFESAAAFLACDKASTAACIILDVVLPDMSGLDLQRQLAGTCPPIIFATRQAEISCSVRAMKAGAFDFLTVPFGQQLACSLQAALELDRVSRPEREQLIGMRERCARLTPRELQVMRLLVHGMSNKCVAHELGISEITAQIHRGRVKQKMEVNSLAELVRIAIRLGIARADASQRVAAAPQKAKRTPTLKFGPTLSYGTPLKKLESILL